MSRIDEALKRSAQENRQDDPAIDAGGMRPAGDPAAVLDCFVEEAAAVGQVAFAPQPPLPVQQPSIRPATPAPTTPVSNKLVTSPDVEPITVDQFRRLAAVLHDLQQESGLKTLLVSSAVPGEGKTMTVVNLALTISESFQRRVLLIDADLRRPTIHDLLGCSNRSGLADVLAVRELPMPLVSISPNLSVLTAGSRTSLPLAHLTSDRMRNLIQAAAANFDWVLIDTPPVGLLPDAQLVARMSEGVLFVIAAGSTPHALVNRSIAEIGADRIVGTVLNRVELRALQTAGYYRAGYGKYYQPEYGRD